MVDIAKHKYCWTLGFDGSTFEWRRQLSGDVDAGAEVPMAFNEETEVFDSDDLEAIIWSRDRGFLIYFYTTKEVPSEPATGA